MQCPRCGAENPPAVRACIRCGLPAGPAPQPPQPQPPQPQPPQPQPQPAQPLGPSNPAQAGWGSYRAGHAAGSTTAAQLTSAKRRGTGMIPMGLAMLGVLATGVYAVFAFTSRHSMFSDIEHGSKPTSSLLDDAKSNDTLNSVLVWIAIVVGVAALVLWLVALVRDNRGRSSLGVAGLGLVTVGVLVAVVGALIVNSAINDRDAGKAATDVYVLGLGFALCAVGLLLGALALRASPAAPSGTTSAAGSSPPGYSYPPQAPGGYPPQGAGGPAPYAQPGTYPPQGHGPYGQTPPGTPRP